MDTLNIKEKLLKKLPEKNIIEDCSMAKYTTFRCGGNASLLVLVQNIDELRYCVSIANAFNADWMVLGNGSNVLFTDGGYDGMVIKLAGEFSEIVPEGNRITAGAGAMLSFVSKIAAAKGFTGLEFGCGIPGSIGGAIFMNAGAYDGTIADVVSSVTAITKDGDIYLYEKDELDFSYRHSRFMDSEEIILFAALELKNGNTDEINEKIADFTLRRKTKQPLNYPSAGSFFKRPEGNFAGALIEQAGLKGVSVGGAQVSELHAGFIINAEKASATDILGLCRLVQDTVYKQSGIMLEPEVRIIGK